MPKAKIDFSFGIMHMTDNCDFDPQISQHSAMLKESCESAIKLSKTVFCPDLIHSNLAAAVGGLFNEQNGKIAS